MGAASSAHVLIGLRSDRSNNSTVMFGFLQRSEINCDSHNSSSLDKGANMALTQRTCVVN